MHSLDYENLVRPMCTTRIYIYCNKTKLLSKVQECQGDQKKLFNIVDKLPNRRQPNAMQQHDHFQITTVLACFSRIKMTPNLLFL